MNWESIWYGPFDARARAWSLALWPASVLYGLASRACQLTFDLGLRAPVRVPGVRVVSVGNLVVGGAGKTPLTIELAKRAQALGMRVAVLTRGYGRLPGPPRRFSAEALPSVEVAGDEARLIARSCPGVTVFVDADRVRSARAAAAAGASLLILDDGFQHRRLARDVDLLIDAGEGNGRCLPAGPLREPRAARARATAIVGRDGQPGDIEVTLTTSQLRAPDGSLSPLSGPIVLLTGIARPARALQSLVAAGATVVATHCFPDHHPFTPSEVEVASRDATRFGARLVTTAKDAERLPPSLHVLVQTLTVTKGSALLDELLRPPALESAAGSSRGTRRP